jgi:hypothetical protein
VTYILASEWRKAWHCTDCQGSARNEVLVMDNNKQATGSTVQSRRVLSRRDFLASTALVGAVSAIGSLASATSPGQPKEIHPPDHRLVLRYHASRSTQLPCLDMEIIPHATPWGCRVTVIIGRISLSSPQRGHDLSRDIGPNRSRCPALCRQTG